MEEAPAVKLQSCKACVIGGYMLMGLVVGVIALIIRVICKWTQA